MGKLRAFGTKARGSVGAVTYYVVNGQQIAREKATEVKNPKSSAQSTQRMKMAPAQKFSEAFSGIVNHSWQGVKYGTASRQKFMSEAMKQNGGPYVVKGTTTFVPGTYLIADGSLPEIKGKFIRTTEMFKSNLLTPQFTSRAEFVNNIIANNPNFESGDKLTFIAILGVRTDRAFTSPLSSTFYPVIKQVILRQQLEDGETDDFEQLKSDSLTDEEGYLALDLTTAPFETSYTSEVTAFAIIHSRGQNESNDQRSKTRFAITERVYNTFYTDSAYKLALASYQNTSNAPLGAEWYLNNFPVGTIGRVVTKKWTRQPEGDTYDVLALVITEAGANQTFILVDGRKPIDITGRPYVNFSVEATTPTLPWNRNYLKLFSGN